MYGKGAVAWMRGCSAGRSHFGFGFLGPAHPDLLRKCPAHGQIVKPLTKVLTQVVCQFSVNRAKILNGSV